MNSWQIIWVCWEFVIFINRSLFSSFNSSILYIEAPPIPSTGLIIIVLWSSKKSSILFISEVTKVFGINSLKCNAKIFSLNSLIAVGLLNTTAPCFSANPSKWRAFI